MWSIIVLECVQFFKCVLVHFTSSSTLTLFLVYLHLFSLKTVLPLVKLAALMREENANVFSVQESSFLEMPATRYVTWSSTVSGKTIILLPCQDDHAGITPLRNQAQRFCTWFVTSRISKIYLCVNFHPNVIRRNIIPKFVCRGRHVGFPRRVTNAATI